MVDAASRTRVFKFSMIHVYKFGYFFIVMILTSNFLFQLFTVCDTENIFCFADWMTPHLFYLRQTGRGSRTKLLRRAIRSEERMLRHDFIFAMYEICLFTKPGISSTCDVQIQFKSNPVRPNIKEQLFTSVFTKIRKTLP